MQLMLESEKSVWRVGESVVVRLLAFNDAYEPVALDRRLLVGPNPQPAQPTGIPFPVSVEPAFASEEQNVVMLNPWCYYGRQRSLDGLPAGSVTVHGYLLRRAIGSLQADGPADADALLISAEPLALTIEEGA